MTNNMYYVAEEKILNEIANEKKFSFRAILKLLTAGAILGAVNIEFLYARFNRHADCTPVITGSEISELRDGKGRTHNHSKRFYSPLPFRVIFYFHSETLLKNS